MSGAPDVKLPVYPSDNNDPLSSKGLLNERDEGLPTAVTNATSAKTAASMASAEGIKKIWPGYIIMVWIALSSGVILQNAYILRTLQFNYPIALTTWHLVYATIGTRLLLRFTHLLDDLHKVQMSWDRWLHLSLSVSFIQMLKAFTSVAVLGMSVLFGLEQMQPRKFVIVIAISCGVALASYGEIAFDMGGFICQALGIAFESARLVSIQLLMSGLKMGPLVSLYYFAPVCAGLNMMLIPFFEGAAPFQDALEVVGLPILVGNATTAFALNVAVVFLIGCASSLVLTLSGVIKDILLVLGSVVGLREGGGRGGGAGLRRLG
uniref:GDP-mannose transporter n=1 Tax=Rhodotorula toruloides TaxID=5286 RepID=A0A0K3CKG8_RHOTO